MSLSDNSVEIANLEALLNSGAKSVTTDGLSATYDLDQVRKRLAELKRESDPTAIRSRCIGLNFGGAQI